MLEGNPSYLEKQNPMLTYEKSLLRNERTLKLYYEKFRMGNTCIPVADSF